ncbi:MAG TPA: prepilin-type N-terminal cleavage/methylation domain-containing protein [Chthoniobacteraceae bacterium]|nr:prepilin-type N-terminal cleavage/methylation domain-containing protein [Chthoniobacteraceae bacterium]
MSLQRFHRKSGQRPPSVAACPFRSAFTLTESLLAIVILAVLLSLLFPAISRYRAAAENGTCVSHLRKLGNAIHQYTIDNDGYLPPAAQGHGGTPVNGKIGTLEEFLEPYVGPWVDKARLIAADTFYCPTNVRRGSPPREGFWINEQGVRRYKGWSGYMIGYTINAAIHSLIPPADVPNQAVRLSRVRNPSRTLSLADMPERPDGGRNPAKLLNAKGYFDPAQLQSTWFGGVHNGRCNLLFVDGHVEAFKIPGPLPVCSVPEQEKPWF